MITKTTDLARTFLDDYDQLPTEIPGATGFEPGRLAWFHGVNQGGVRTPGVFYGKDTAFNDSPPKPWTADDRYHDRGEIGYSAPELQIAIIGWRDQWFVPGREKGDLPEWLMTYQSGAKKLTEYLIQVRGLDDPMVLSVNGRYKAGPIAQIVSTYRRGALAQAMRKVKRTLPLWAFWLPIANQRDATGRTIYINAKDASGKEYGSVVTPPALADQPGARSVAEIEAGIAVYVQYRDWLKYKRLPQGTTEGTYHVEERKALNAPEPISEEEEF